MRTHLLRRRLIKRFELQIPNVLVFKRMRCHAANLNLLARNDDRLHLRPPATPDVKRHLSPGITTHPIDRILQRHVLGRLIVNAHNHISGLNPGTPRGRPLHRGDDHEIVVAHPHDKTTPCKTAVSRHHIFKQIRRKQIRMRIERPKHPVDHRIL